MTKSKLSMFGAAAAYLAFAGFAAAQPAPTGDTVSWTATSSAESVKPGERLALTLHGTVRPGWHVYALNQAPTGPTPLRVRVETGDVAKASAAPKGSAPIREHSQAFGVDTEFYAGVFTVTVPVRVAPGAAAGRQQIPLSVQFQTCNGDICQPPKTVRLSASINVRANG